MLKWIRQFGAGALRNNPPDVAPTKRPLPLDLTDRQTIGSFYQIADDLRDQTPVCPVASGGYLLLDATDVKAAFSDKTLSNQPSRFSAIATKNRGKYVAADVAANIPPFLDAPEHVQVRRWLSKAFFERLKTFTPDIAQISADHISCIEPGQNRLLVEDIARKFVVDTIGRFTGVTATPDEMKQYTSALFRLFAPAKDAETFAQTNEQLAGARAKLDQALADCRKYQKPSLLILLDGSDVPVTDACNRDEMITDNTLLILADGIENVEAAIANVIVRWFSFPQPRPAIDEAFVRETIRKDTPGQTIARIAKEDMQIKEEKVSAGTPVFLSLASANAGDMDGADYSFGMGRHKCLGEQLAITMIRTFCHDLAARNPTINSEQLQYLAVFGHKWPRKISISL